MSLPVFDRSVLEAVDPRGRVDVAASRFIAQLAKQKGLAPQFESVRPFVDLGLLYFLGPEREFDRALRVLAKSAKPAKRPAKRAARPKRKSRVLIPEVMP